ncbi:MAG: YibE/F family protein [Patescibacteria group bacterium]
MPALANTRFISLFFAFLCTLVSVTSFLFPLNANAQELVQDEHVVMKAKVREVLSQEERLVPGTDVHSTYQKISVEIISGPEKGNIVTIENDYLSLSKGEAFYLNRITNGLDGTVLYAVKDPDRLPALAFFAALFLLCTIFFGGMQGLRGLISLAGSLFLILYVLLPGILNGHSALWLSVGVSALIIILGSYITHGFNKTTSAAVLGMLTTVLCTGGLAYVAVHWGRLSGFSSDESIYLDMATRGSIDFAGLLLGGILIGLLGVLYDAAIGQAVSVEELHRAAPHLSRRAIYLRALRIGREHIGALVDTLAIAYVGVSLPLLLLFSNSTTETVGITLNRELFATEIIRAMIGSIGLILAVPITTALSVMILIKPATGSNAAIIEEEEKALEMGAGKHHGHSH